MNERSRVNGQVVKSQFVDSKEESNEFVRLKLGHHIVGVKDMVIADYLRGIGYEEVNDHQELGDKYNGNRR